LQKTSPYLGRSEKTEDRTTKSTKKRNVGCGDEGAASIADAVSQGKSYEENRKEGFRHFFVTFASTSLDFSLSARRAKKKKAGLLRPSVYGCRFGGYVMETQGVRYSLRTADGYRPPC
jgi:hypothetical protein